MVMTREEIIAKWDGMTPRERNAWVAEDITRWGPVEWYENSVIRKLCPEYTTDISAAWAITRLFTHYDMWMDNGKHGCKFGGGSYVNLAVHGIDSAPKAICLAALIAKLTA
jgi:hypothetical protein